MRLCLVVVVIGFYDAPIYHMSYSAKDRLLKRIKQTGTNIHMKRMLVGMNANR